MLEQFEKGLFSDTLNDTNDFSMKKEKDIFISAVDKTSLDEVTNVLEIIDNSNDDTELMISNCLDVEDMKENIEII